MKSKHRGCVVAAAAATTAAVSTTGGGASGKMKSVILYPYGPLTATGCCRILHARNLALTSAIYTINISLLIVLIYSWRINVNVRKSGDLEDVYYGVQVAYFAIIGTQISMIILSIMLVFGIYKENPGLIVPWIIGYITFMALEAVAMVYSNVLRDHVNKHFDAMCKAEVAFFITRAFINVISMWGVLRFYNMVRSGITWKGPEAKTALTCHHHHRNQRPRDGSCNCRRGRGRGRRRQLLAEEERKPIGCCFFDFIDYDDDDIDDDYDDDDDDDEDEFAYDDDDYYSRNGNGDGINDDDDDDDVDDNDAADDDGTDSSDCSMLGAATPALASSSFISSSGFKRQYRRGQRSRNANNNNIRTVLINKRHNKYKIAQPQSRLEVINESERSAGSGSDENDSLLVAYDSASSLASV